MNCRILPHRIDSGPANMALDEALLDSVSRDPSAAVFRTYGWTEPTLSLGYFQRIGTAEAEARFATAPIVRRPTGGGAIWHEHEITYAVVLPREHPLGHRAEQLYRAVHAAIRTLFRAAGAEMTRRGDEQADADDDVARRGHRGRPFLCFADRDPEDLVIGPAKVVGSAQRRRPRAILQHGSILLARADTTSELPGVADLASLVTDSAGLIARCHSRIPGLLQLEGYPGGLSSWERDRAEALERDVYRDVSWTRKR